MSKDYLIKEGDFRVVDCIQHGHSFRYIIHAKSLSIAFDNVEEDNEVFVLTRERNNEEIVIVGMLSKDYLPDEVQDSFRMMIEQ